MKCLLVVLFNIVVDNGWIVVKYDLGLDVKGCERGFTHLPTKVASL